MSRLVEPSLQLEHVPGDGEAMVRLYYSDGARHDRTLSIPDAYDTLKMIHNGCVDKILLNYKQHDGEELVAIKVEKQIFPRRQPGLVSKFCSWLFNPAPFTSA